MDGTMGNNATRQQGRILRTIETPLRFLEGAALLVAMLCILALIGVTAADVIARYAYGRALGWAYDLAIVLMIGLCFCSLASLQARMGNVAVQFLFFKLPLGLRRVSLCLQLAVGVFAAGILGWSNAGYAIEAWQMGWIYGGFGAIPTAVPFGFIGGGCLLLALRLSFQLLQAATADPASEAMLTDATPAEIRS